MTSTKQQAFKMTAVGAALLAIYGPALADDAGIAQLIKPESSVSVGVGSWSNNRPQQGIFDGMRDNGGYGRLDAEIIKRDDSTGTWLRFDARNLGTATPELGLNYERQGDFKAGISYDEITRDNPYTIMTALQGIGTTRLRTSLTASPALGEVTLGTKREKLGLDLVKHLFPGLELSVNLKEEKKTGTRQWGRGGAAEFSVEPINAKTQQVEMVLSHVGQHSQVSGGYYGSWYKNAYSSVDTALTSGANAYLLTLPLDNQAHQLFFNGGYDFTKSTRGTLKVEYGRATQNETLATAGTALALASAPTSLNGRIDTTLYQLGLTSRPSRDLSIAANLRYRNEVDKTPIALYVSTGAGPTVVHNTPYDIKSVTGKVEGTYRLPSNLSIVAGVDLNKQNRTVPVGTIRAGLDVERYVPFRSNLDETTYRLQLRRSLSDSFNGSVTYLHSKRTGSAYSATDSFTSDLVNPTHIADRKRDKWRFTADWTPADNLTVQANYQTAKDDYTNARPYGLIDGKANLFSIDTTYAIGEKAKITAWYSHDDTRANQASGRFAQTTEILEANRVSHLKDIGDAIGIGVRSNATSKLSLGGDLQWTQTRAQYPTDIALTGVGTLLTAYPATTRALPDIKNQIVTVKLFGEYAIDKSSALRVDFIHERWTTDDWTWQIVGGAPFIFGTTTDGTQILSNPKQSSNFIGARYTYKFQ